MGGLLKKTMQSIGQIKHQNGFVTSVMKSPMPALNLQAAQSQHHQDPEGGGDARRFAVENREFAKNPEAYFFRFSRIIPFSEDIPK